MEEKEEPKKKMKEKKSSGMEKINPLKDHVINFNNVKIEIKKGESIEVPKMFIPNLKTEKVIK